jgi:hypothetical protein
MVDSFRRIDYSIRPAKYAERRMLLDVFRRLASFEPLEEYRYVGFGSVWFSDFVLFHRAIGIRHMLSIEKAVGSRDRFEANKPFNIAIDYRPSSVVLPEMGYDRRQFIWLDYDDPITLDMVRDVATVAARARSGTLLAVSVQCHRAPDIAEADRAALNDPLALSAVERFRARMGAHRVAPDLSGAELASWPFGELSRNLFLSEIASALETRRLADPESELRFQPICDFEYEDGAKMTTTVGVFVAPDEQPRLAACYFNQLEFLDPAGGAIYIPTPKLTIKEFRHLEKQLPLPAGSNLDLGFIPPGEASRFAEMYRYFPNFAVVES